MDKKIWTKIINLLVVIGLSLASGALGAALAIRSATNVSEIILTNEMRPPAVSRAGSVANMDAVSSAVRGSVVFYRYHSGSRIDGAFLPTDIVGEGVVLTSDGWIASSADVLLGRDQLVAVFADGVSITVPAGKAIKDEATGLAFVRVESDHLNVAPFGDDTTLLPGENVYAPKSGGLNVFSVFAVRETPVTTRADLIESSEKFSRRLILAGVGLGLGAPVIDASGKIVAVATSENSAVPAAYFTEAMKDVFLGKKIIRPTLGVHYVSVADVKALPSAGFPSEGALLIGLGKIKAVNVGSAAELGGLRDGDVILAVERDRITKDAPLSEVVAEYASGAKVELSVMRAGKQIKLSVTLK